MKLVLGLQDEGVGADQGALIPSNLKRRWQWNFGT